MHVAGLLGGEAPEPAQPAIADVIDGGKTISWPLDEEPPAEIAVLAGRFCSIRRSPR
ncbi:hypothetical protein [Verrucosispora sp. ts21]|uniref:hypothetical protein n=1 Tax=Verrucosispora sp. ts21 TaxID=2069341 RepID=UPI001304D0DB|nr:hypothetical protein [Verrucosispora sp. ts21]